MINEVIMNNEIILNKNDDIKSSSQDINKVIIDSPITWKFWQKRRYIVVMMAFLGFCIELTVRVNLSVAIVSMTEKRNIYSENGTILRYEQHFPWTSTQQGLVLSAYFYGYVCTPLIGGYLGARYGGHLVFGIGVFVGGLLNLCIPIAVKLGGIYMIIILRVLIGLHHGVTFASIHSIWTKWAPPLERTRMATIAFSGLDIGTTLAMLICGLMAKSSAWELQFYVFGVLSTLWYVIWIIVVREKPAYDKYITQEELNYIQNSLANTTNTISNNTKQSILEYPWKSILTSKPVYANTISTFSQTWGFFTLMTQLPTYLRDTLKFDYNNVGILSSIPFLLTGITLLFAGYLADLCQVKKWLTLSQVRRYFNCGSTLIITFLIILITFLNNAIAIVVCLTIAIMLGAFPFSSTGVNHLDLAPQYAGVLMGISSTLATLPGIISPTLTGVIVQTRSAAEWNIVFYITGVIYFMGFIIYWFWSTGELQPWAKSSACDDDVSQEKKNDESSPYVYTNESVKIDD